MLARAVEMVPNVLRFGSVIDMSDSWSREEVEAAVADYFVMLRKELNREGYNKAEHNRRLQLLLANRSRGSIERKHQNISAVFLELGYPYIDGYKPLGNYQELLAEVVLEKLTVAMGLNEAVALNVAAAVVEPSVIQDVLSMLVPPPVFDGSVSRLNDGPSRRIPQQLGSAIRPKVARVRWRSESCRSNLIGRHGTRAAKEQGLGICARLGQGVSGGGFLSARLPRTKQLCRRRGSPERAYPATMDVQGCSSKFRSARQRSRFLDFRVV